MTLQEARHVLESANPRDAVLRKAIKVMLEAVPEDPEPYRPALDRRVEAILSALADKKDSSYILVTRGVRVPIIGVYPCIIDVKEDEKNEEDNVQ